MVSITEREYVNKIQRKATKCIEHSRKAAKKFGVESTLTVREVRELFLRHDTCHYCGRDLIGVFDRTIDHMVPMSHGGTNTLSNVVVCCDICNAQKSRCENFEYQNMVRRVKNDMTVLRVR